MLNKSISGSISGNGALPALSRFRFSCFSAILIEMLLQREEGRVVLQLFLPTQEGRHCTPVNIRPPWSL